MIKLYRNDIINGKNDKNDKNDIINDKNNKNDIEMISLMIRMT